MALAGGIRPPPGTCSSLFLYFFNFLSLQFQNIKFFVTLFCSYKVETWYTHEQRIDPLCTPNASSQNILVLLFFSFFLSLQLAKIKNLLLQNCFNIPLMAMARGMLALFTLCYIWACAWQNQQNDLCSQQRLRSARASTQSDQSLRCPLEGTLGP